jgi:hypothetical protein
LQDAKTFYNRLQAITRYERESMMMIGFLVPALAAGLIIYATIDIYRHRDNDQRKSKRKNDDYYLEDTE